MVGMNSFLVGPGLVDCAIGLFTLSWRLSICHGRNTEKTRKKRPNHPFCDVIAFEFHFRVSSVSFCGHGLSNLDAHLPRSCDCFHLDTICHLLVEVPPFDDGLSLILIRALLLLF